MKKFRVVNVSGSFGIFLDDEIEAVDSIEAMESICYEIMDNIGNYIDIELEEIESDEDDEPDYHDIEVDRRLEEEFDD